MNITKHKLANNNPILGLLYQTQLVTESSMFRVHSFNAAYKGTIALNQVTDYEHD